MNSTSVARHSHEERVERSPDCRRTGWYSKGRAHHGMDTVTPPALKSKNDPCVAPDPSAQKAWAAGVPGKDDPDPDSFPHPISPSELPPDHLFPDCIQEIRNRPFGFKFGAPVLCPERNTGCPTIWSLVVGSPRMSRRVRVSCGSGRIPGRNHPDRRQRIVGYFGRSGSNPRSFHDSPNLPSPESAVRVQALDGFEE